MAHWGKDLFLPHMKAYTKGDYQIHLNTLSAVVKTIFIKGKNKINAHFRIVMVIGREAGRWDSEGVYT